MNRVLQSYFIPHLIPHAGKCPTRTLLSFLHLPIQPTHCYQNKFLKHKYHLSSTLKIVKSFPTASQAFKFSSLLFSPPHRSGFILPHSAAEKSFGLAMLLPCPENVSYTLHANSCSYLVQEHLLPRSPPGCPPTILSAFSQSLP